MGQEPETPLGAAIRVARLVRGKSVVDVARGSGVPESRIRAFEDRGIAPLPAEFFPIWKYLSSNERHEAPQMESAAIETRSARPREDRRG